MGEAANQAGNDFGGVALKSDSIIVSIISNKIINPLVRFMVNMGSFIILVMIILVDSDVVGRYLKQPIQGTDELIGFLFLCFAACSFSYTQKEKKHIRIDLFLNKIPPRGRLALDFVCYLFTFVAASLISRQLFIVARQFILDLQSGSSVSEILSIPYSPFLIILGIGFAVFALVSLSDTIISIIKLAKG